MLHGAAVAIHFPTLSHAKMGVYGHHLGEDNCIVFTDDGFRLEVPKRWVEEVKDEEVKDESWTLLVVVVTAIAAAILFGFSWWMLW